MMTGCCETTLTIRIAAALVAFRARRGGDPVGVLYMRIDRMPIPS
jgi:hypothetical protein